MKKKQKVIYFDSRQDIAEKELIEEFSGKLAPDEPENKLMRSVLENDKSSIDKGKLITESINQGMQSFTPDLLYEQLVKNYTMAQHIYGPSILKLATGYDPDYIKKNIQIPEFRRELKFQIEKNIEALRQDGLIDSNYVMTSSGLELASLVTYFEELDKLRPQGLLGEKEYRKLSMHGSKNEIMPYKKGARYRDIAIKQSVKTAIRRGHTHLQPSDLKVFERQSKGKCCIVYGLDASGSMKGNKIDACKRAGIALAYKAIQEKDKVGLITFGTDIKTTIEPTLDFAYLLRHIVSIRASKQTDLSAALKKSIELFPSEDITKHLILITDAMPTVGTNPEHDTLEQVSSLKNHGITISMIGINLDEKGRRFAQKIVELGEGKLYAINNTENVDKIVLEDYYSMV